MKRNLKTLTKEDKVQLVEYVEANPNRRRKDVAVEFNVPESTLSRILSKKTEIIEAAKDEAKCKRIKSCEYPAVEEALLTWFKQYRDRNV